MNTDASLNPFFAPQGALIIGASSDPTKLGYGLAQLAADFPQLAEIEINPMGDGEGVVAIDVRLRLAEV